jgi:hypothetical protein
MHRKRWISRDDVVQSPVAAELVLPKKEIVAENTRFPGGFFDKPSPREVDTISFFSS